MKKLYPYLQLIRPANIVTSLTNVISGITVSLYFLKDGNFSDYSKIIYLLVATTGLYGGGIIFNDFFDIEIDTIERPNRPIPSGLVTKKQALIFGSFVFILALISAKKVSIEAFIISLTICVLCFIYNIKTKHYRWLGGLTLALCRGLNLLLGTTIIGDHMMYFWPFGFIPFGLTIAITSVSQVEVYGNDTSILKKSIIFYVITLLTFFVLISDYINKVNSYALFLILFAIINGFYLTNAIINPIPINIQKVVKWGVLSFIILDAAITSSFSNFYYGLLLLCLLPISIILSKFFAVT